MNSTEMTIANGNHLNAHLCLICANSGLNWLSPLSGFCFITRYTLHRNQKNVKRNAVITNTWNAIPATMMWVPLSVESSDFKAVAATPPPLYSTVSKINTKDPIIPLAKTKKPTQAVNLLRALQPPGLHRRKCDLRPRTANCQNKPICPYQHSW